jgi:hypothetical protein
VTSRQKAITPRASFGIEPLREKGSVLNRAASRRP